MIIYESTKGEFMEHVTDDTIVECIHKKYIEKMGKWNVLGSYVMRH